MDNIKITLASGKLVLIAIISHKTRFHFPATCYRVFKLFSYFSYIKKKCLSLLLVMIKTAIITQYSVFLYHLKFYLNKFFSTWLLSGVYRRIQVGEQLMKLPDYVLERKFSGFSSSQECPKKISSSKKKPF